MNESTEINDLLFTNGSHDRGDPTVSRVSMQHVLVVGQEIGRRPHDTSDVCRCFCWNL